MLSDSSPLFGDSESRLYHNYTLTDICCQTRVIIDGFLGEIAAWTMENKLFFDGE